MRILQLKCPSCGSNLEVEDSLDMFYCKYCGSKIILADQSDQLIKAKADMAKLSHEEQMYKMQIEEEKRQQRSYAITFVSFMIFCIIMIFVLYSCSVRIE